MNSSDILIIGAGPGGYETAARAASMGMSVTLIERDKLGGTCLNRGCIPTKALCRVAEIADDIASASQFGISAEKATLDYEAVVKRKDAVVDSLREGVAQLLGNVNVVFGEAAFESNDNVRVGDEIYTAPKIVIATGSTPARPHIPGIENALTSDDFLNLTTLPASITIIGGGVIGLEFASILRSFSVAVTVIEGMKEILPNFDTEIAKRLRMSLKRRGITVVTDAMVTEILPGGGVKYTVKGKEKVSESEMVLVAVGRRPSLPAGLSEAGVKLTPRRFIEVDSAMQTSAPGVYAIGDVNGLSMLAHAATAQGEIVLGVRKDFNPVPGAVFTRPECSMVGLTEQECMERQINYLTGKSTFQANGKARAMGEPEGMVKILISKDSNKILGAHIMGTHASDLIAEVVLAMTAELTAQALKESVHTHPTLSEAVSAAVGCY
ncbi:MAG: dihydrolipoyl dehydrogenase [Muribaculaceae bacterium]|nr:dihydrolipoyl dehydrogenase [Muribaculaceae bacterium]